MLSPSTSAFGLALLSSLSLRWSVLFQTCIHHVCTWSWWRPLKSICQNQHVRRLFWIPACCFFPSAVEAPMLLTEPTWWDWKKSVVWPLLHDFNVTFSICCASFFLPGSVDGTIRVWRQESPNSANSAGSQSSTPIPFSLSPNKGSRDHLLEASDSEELCDVGPLSSSSKDNNMVKASWLCEHTVESDGPVVSNSSEYLCLFDKCLRYWHFLHPSNCVKVLTCLTFSLLITSHSWRAVLPLLPWRTHSIRRSRE